MPDKRQHQRKTFIRRLNQEITTTTTRIITRCGYKQVQQRSKLEQRSIDSSKQQNPNLFFDDDERSNEYGKAPDEFYVRKRIGSRARLASRFSLSTIIDLSKSRPIAWNPCCLAAKSIRSLWEGKQRSEIFEFSICPVDTEKVLPSLTNEWLSFAFFLAWTWLEGKETEECWSFQSKLSTASMNRLYWNCEDYAATSGAGPEPCTLFVNERSRALTWTVLYINYYFKRCRSPHHVLILPLQIPSKIY